VLELFYDFAIFFFIYDFAADLNTQFPLEKIRIFSGSYNARSARPLLVTSSAIGGQGRTAETRGTVNFLHITFL